MLDDPAADPGAVHASLRNIARSNRWFGGSAAVRFGLTRALRTVPPGSRLTLLDIGTGFGDLPGVAVRWGASRGLTIVPLGLERNRTAAHLARSAGVPTAVGCAGSLPLKAASVDLVLVSQLAHHLAPQSIVQLVSDCNALARRAVVLCDLRRAWFAGVAFEVGAWLLRFDPATRADGVTSVRRGFSPRELAELLRRAGVMTPVYRRPGYRLVAAWTPGPQ